MFAVNRSTASTWARKSRVVELRGDRDRLGHQLVEATRAGRPAAPAAWGRRPSAGRPGSPGRPARRRGPGTAGTAPPAAPGSRRPGRRPLVSERDRQVGPVGGGEQREDRAEAPADDVHRRPPACRLTSSIAWGTTSSTQCSMPRPRLAKDTSPYSTRYVGRPGVDEVLDQRAAATQVEAERRRGQRGDQQDRVAVLAGRRPGDGSGRPRAARPRRSGCAAWVGDRPGRRTTSCGRRWRPRRRPGPAWGSDPCAVKLPASRPAQRPGRVRGAAGRPARAGPPRRGRRAASSTSVEVLGVAARAEGPHGRGAHPRQLVRRSSRAAASPQGSSRSAHTLQAHLGHPPGLVAAAASSTTGAHGVVPDVEQSAGTPDPGPVRLPGPAAVQHVPASRAAEEEQRLRVARGSSSPSTSAQSCGGAARADVRLEEAEQVPR